MSIQSIIPIMPGRQAVETLEMFRAVTGVSLSPTQVSGLYVWSKLSTTSGPAKVHIETPWNARTVYDRANKRMLPEHYQLPGREPWRIYRGFCTAEAARLDRERVDQLGLVLLVRRDGRPTRKLILLHNAIK